ncbi:hypothetical protein EW026_g5308 [Hermanssonia centrifuga]|uniref:Uncharacterized protein n=1 Tax=Hermanssonia centrifuga TaxID=98765 RepID=A0A4S4KFH6_9APHY|nr:hypothetical protein EW026_g5308 [Hermanssonia centrifuga]
MRRLGIRTMYGAMWDEYDEGTAYMPIVSKKRQVPVHDKYNFMALDEDGFDLPPDWYMRIAGFAGESLRGDRMMHETFPSKELQDYWSTRPRYEEKESDNASASGSNQKKSESWEEWDKLTKEKEGKDEPPPPPYSLEAEEPPVPPRPSATGALNAVPSSPEPFSSPAFSYPAASNCPTILAPFYVASSRILTR